MRIVSLIFLLVLVSCTAEKKDSKENTPEDIALIEREITDFHQALRQVYNGIPMDTDSLMDSYFDKNVYYVTYWGMAEPIDSTKSRLRRALPGIKDYENRLESMHIRIYNDGAYAFFILRQSYLLNGILMDEYLPTTFVLEQRDNKWKVVHSQRSADFHTIQCLMKLTRQHEE